MVATVDGLIGPEGRPPAAPATLGDFTRWEEHDAYQKALDRLLSDLRIEKG